MHMTVAGILWWMGTEEIVPQVGWVALCYDPDGSPRLALALAFVIMPLVLLSRGPLKRHHVIIVSSRAISGEYSNNVWGAGTSIGPVQRTLQKRNQTLSSHPWIIN
eukprot:7387358-Prymnesium_polylepis.1